MRTIHIPAFIAVVSLFLASCSAITSPGRFTFDDEPVIAECPATEAADLGIEFRNFEAFENQQIEFRVIDVDPTDGESLVLRGHLDELHPIGVSEDGTDNSTLTCLVFKELIDSFDNLIVRTFVDLNEDGVYDGTSEPGWQDGVSGGVAVVDGSEMSTGIDDPPSPVGSFTYQLTMMGPHTPPTQHLALMIIEPVNGLPVGYFRIAEVDDVNLDIFIGEILEPDADYDVEFYADFVQNGSYDPPPMGDHSWFESYSSDGEGNIDETFEHNTDFDPLDFF